MAPPMDPLAEAWLGSLGRAANTVRTYRTNLVAFLGWTAPQNLDLLSMREDDLNRYSLHVHQQGWSDATTESRISTVRNFYKWLFDSGRMEHNPASSLRKKYGGKNVIQDVLTVHDLRLLVSSTSNAQDRATLLLILMHGLGGNDIAKLNLSDLVQRHESYSLRLRHNTYMPLPDLLLEPLLEAVGERKRGPLLLNRNGNRLTHINVRHSTQRCGRAANLGVDVVPQVLVASMRDILIKEPIPWVAVLQGLGTGANTNLMERVKIAPPAPQHLAYRMALLLRPDGASTDAYFDHADSLSAHHGLPTAARITLAGSAFERHLRELAIRESAIPADIKKTTLGFLAGRLRDEGVLSEPEFRVCGTVGTTRDWAAHGWFEKLTDQEADQAVANMRRIVRDHPL